MIRGDPTLEECLELLQARTGRGCVEISQAIREICERHVEANNYPSEQSFLDIQNVALSGFERWTDRAIVDLNLLIRGAPLLHRKTVRDLAARALSKFAKSVKDATNPEAFLVVVGARTISDEHRKLNRLLKIKLRLFKTHTCEGAAFDALPPNAWPLGTIGSSLLAPLTMEPNGPISPANPGSRRRPIARAATELSELGESDPATPPSAHSRYSKP